MFLRKQQLAAATAVALALSAGGISAGAQDAAGEPVVVSQTVLDRLNAMQKTIDALHAKVEALEKEKAAAQQQPAPPTPANNPAQHAPAETAKPAAAPAIAEEKPAVDPYFKGFMRLWDSDTYLKFGGYVRVNLDVNDTKMADNTEFITSGIPVQGETNYGSGENVAFNGKASRIDFELRRKTDVGNLRIYYENDFFGGANNNYSYHFRQFYAQVGNLLGGQTSTTFTDDDIWPDIVDYQGPNSAAYVRQVQLRYTIPLLKKEESNLALSLAVEQPDSQIDATGAIAGAQSRNRQPDYVARLRYETNDWHVQLAGIARDLGYRDGNDNGQSVFGGGASLTAGTKVFGEDRIGVQLAGGYGIGRYFQDVSGLNADAALTAGGDLRPLPVLGAYATYTHQWSTRWRSSFTGGYLEVDNASGQAGSAFHRSAYASANVIWQPTKAFWVGAEILYGYNQHKDGRHGDAWQMQLSVNYDFVP